MSAMATARPATPVCARLLVIGPPGAGKGTQCEILSERLGIPHVSTGNLFREAIGAGSPLGRVVGRFVERGLLVPDKLVLRLVYEKIRSCASGQAEFRGFILDGVPRTIRQAEALDAMMASSPIDAVIHLHVSDEVVLARLCAGPYRRRGRSGRSTTVVVSPGHGPDGGVDGTTASRAGHQWQPLDQRGQFGHCPATRPAPSTRGRSVVCDVSPTVVGVSGAGIVTIRPRHNRVDIRVRGSLDDMSGRALRDAVEAGVLVGLRVTVDIDMTNGFTSDAIRDLAACAHAGALLRFNPEEEPDLTRLRNGADSG